jgi:hypothetical protein
LVAGVDLLAALVDMFVLALFVTLGIEFFNLLARNVGNFGNIFYIEAALNDLRRNLSGMTSITESVSIWWT